MNSSRKKLITVAIIVLIAIFCALIGALAYIKSTMPNWNLGAVNSVAQIESDGSMVVTDQRTIKVDGENVVVNWEIAAPNTKSKTTIAGVRLISESDDGVNVEVVSQGEFNDSTHKLLDDDTIAKENQAIQWFFDEEDDWFYISLPNYDNQEVLVEVTYSITNAYYVYDDVAEVYWDYLPQDKLNFFQRLFMEDAKISITARVLIPVLEQNVAVNADNTWGWGHGFVGNVDFLEVGGYQFTSEASSLSITSRAHVIFPSSWLSNFDKSSPMNVGGARKGSAKTEEQTWKDSETVKVGNSFKVSAGLCSVAAAILVINSLVFWRKRSLYTRLLNDKSAANGVELLQMQLKFDDGVIYFKKVVLLLAAASLIACLGCLFLVHSIAGAVAFAFLCAMQVIFANYAPLIHKSFLDIIFS